MEPAAAEEMAHHEDADIVVAMDMSQVEQYLTAVAPPMLGDAQSAGFLEQLQMGAAHEKLRQFVNDPQVTVFSVSKAQDDGDDAMLEQAQPAQYTFELEVSFAGTKSSQVAFIKRHATALDGSTPCASQLQAIDLGNGVPFETLHSYIHSSFSPLFHSYVMKTQRFDKELSEKKQGIPAVKKKMQELEQSLLQCQQSLEIPEVHLEIDAHVKRVALTTKEANQKLDVEAFSDQISNSEFLNSIQGGVNRWIREIQRVTKHQRDPSSGPAIQEINFHLGHESALLDVVEQLKQPEIDVTLSLLKQAKRFHATMGLDTAAQNLQKAVTRVQNYNQLMHDFPINDLLGASEVDAMMAAIQAIFKHMTVLKTKNLMYPVERAVKLVEAISRDVTDVLVRMLSTKRLMQLPYDNFESLTAGCEALFKTWEEQVEKDFRHKVLKYLADRQVRGQTNFKLKIVHELGPLRDRIEAIRQFRRQHEELNLVINTVLGSTSSSEFNTETELRNAFEHVKAIDVLDVSADGQEAWRFAMEQYDNSIDRIEGRVTAKLQDKLGACRNANEMFRVFSKFNALFYRPKIRGAIQQYQTQLIDRVKSDIKGLQEKFKHGYPKSEAYKMSKLRDLPDVAGSIIWARQIEHQLDMYLNRVRDVLGEDWEQDNDGRILKQESDTFRKKLNAESLYTNWAKEMSEHSSEIRGEIFEVGRKGGHLVLQVHYDPATITMFKEVRNFKWLGFRPSTDINMMASQARDIYPSAMSLRETLRTYHQSCFRITEHIRPLIASHKISVQALISEGVNLRWEDKKKELQSYAQRLADEVLSFQDGVNDLLAVDKKIERQLSSLSTCAWDKQVFQQILGEVQKLVDDLNLASHSNLELWVTAQNKKIEDHLVARLQEGISVWNSAFSETVDATQNPQSVDEEEEEQHKPKCDVQVQSSVHQIKIRNQLMYLDPPLEFARKNWVEQLHLYLGIICNLPTLKSSRYDEWAAGVGSSDVDQGPAFYTHLLKRLPGGELESAYHSIESHLEQVREYVETWLQYQALWDMQASYVYDRLGDDINLWQQLLTEIKLARTTFDTSETFKEYGPVKIDYRQVQAKVNNKYDAWHKELLNQFGQRLGAALVAFHANVSDARGKLERAVVEFTTAEAVAFLTQLQEYKSKASTWEAEVEGFQNGQSLLQKQRFQFPQDWLYFDHVAGEWSAFQEILRRKNEEVASEIPLLRKKIIEEDKSLQAKVNDVQSEWSASKPLRGSIPCADALGTLQVYDGRVTQLQEHMVLLAQAKQALELEVSSTTSLELVIEEIGDLKGVWQALAEVWEKLTPIRETAWSAVIPRKVRTFLDEVGESLKQLPNRMRQYEAFEFLRNQIKSYQKVNNVVSDLRSESMRDRHWKSLMTKLNLRCMFSELTLGDLWDADLEAQNKIVQDVIRVAQGEMALEEYLRQVREHWEQFELETISYQGKCRLIKGWDDLFLKLNDHLQSLGSMKMSPFFKTFEEEALSWEDKINRARNMFDVWIDVQRRWVYLEGIFYGSADIKHQLPNEYSRFKSIDNEFLNMMKKSMKTPNVLEILNIQGQQRTLDRISDLLGKIQKALGEYLEKERASFPRFYFVGDEDLLEIIGNSKDPMKIQKHLRKMFAGIALLQFSEDASQVHGMESPEGEAVAFNQAVQVKEKKMNEWLFQVQQEMISSLALQLDSSVQILKKLYVIGNFEAEAYCEWVAQFPAQLTLLSTQVMWTQLVEQSLEGSDNDRSATVTFFQDVLDCLANQVLTSISSNLRRKFEQLIKEIVHGRDTLRSLIEDKVSSKQDFNWLYFMRYYFDSSVKEPEKKLTIHVANASFFYGYEYLGINDGLVQTPLIDSTYLTLTQALHSRLGGSPFGPAGTGKTESVKALGAQLGRYVIVFNCDENFDLLAMGRIFVGLCQCGAWGCFDEFNRLEERILSAVSQQILTIQTGLRDDLTEIELMNKSCSLNGDTGIFVTMNPGYAGRSNLPDNLKQLFHQAAMIKPDRQMITQVVLYSQGFKSAEMLSHKVVPLFELCADQLSQQPHYDFGLRALKYVLVSAGNLKRRSLAKAGEASGELDEAGFLIRSMCDTMIPKLVQPDIPLFNSLICDVFPGADIAPPGLEELTAEVHRQCEKRFLNAGPLWIQKILQLYQIQEITHGVMLVGPSGSGKTSAWKVLLKALQAVDHTEGVSYVMDPKAITKEQLYGSLDPTTREWSDGVFTATLRKIIDNVRGEANKRHWIMFDGDVDPEWVENLNSVLDDNKLLTLPNGERLMIPPNVRIMFEVENLKYATLATVSRCGMAWFSEETMNTEMVVKNYLSRMCNETMDELAEHLSERLDLEEEVNAEDGEQKEISQDILAQRQCADVLSQPQFSGSDGLISRALEFCGGLPHVMDYTSMRALSSTFALINKGVRAVVDYNQSHEDFPLEPDHISNYITKRLVFSILWGMGGSLDNAQRVVFSTHLSTLSTGPLPDSNGPPLVDYEVRIEDGEWSLWNKQVPSIEVEAHRAGASDVVITTVDTVRHEEVLHSAISEHQPVILCGPPGSGKSMTMTATLKTLPDFEMVALNFSSGTGPELIIKTLEQYCEVKRTPKGLVCKPVQLGRWLVIFCDEINLPESDNYGTQRVISFIRQLTEARGYWRASDLQWIKIENVQFVGACNPPTDSGRVDLSHRFLRHVLLLMVDFPAEESLKIIYGTFNRAILRLVPSLRGFAENVTDAMVDIFEANKKRFSADIQPHYIFSPRELTRWIRAMMEAIAPVETMSQEQLVRLLVHEGLRLFHDRLVTRAEREWVIELIDSVARKHFTGCDLQEALKKPIIFSTFLKKDYSEVNVEELREYVKARLRVFYEEELNVPLVVFDDVLDHILRIDRVLRQPLGHCLLIGVSGAGKTVLSRFVAWMNGLSVFQVKMTRKYTIEDFEVDLRLVMKRSGCKAEKICFIFDEANIMKSSFLELMNALLASGEVPGLFDGEEWTGLMHECKAAATRDGLMLDTEDELYKRFIHQVQHNLHIVFTMNPSNPDFSNRTSSSPALFNRCVIDWFGDWSPEAYEQVAFELTNRLDIDDVSEAAAGFDSHKALASSMVFVHQAVERVSESLRKQSGRINYVTPRHYLDFINQYVSLFHEKRSELEDQQLHLNQGLQKLKDTETSVAEMQVELKAKNEQLQEKNQIAEDKLKEMVQKQQEASQAKEEALKLSEEVSKSNVEIQKQRDLANVELGEAEPALLEAKDAVSNVKKAQLDEVRNFSNPPELVKVTMEAVCVALGEKGTPTWDVCRKLMRQDGFIASIVNFDTELLTDKVRIKLKKNYLSNPDFKFETVNRSSKACGPLAKWLSAQCYYAEILDKVQPLRDQVTALSAASEDSVKQLAELEVTVKELEQQIQTYKEEYASLIQETQIIKSELGSVKSKVDRCRGLLKSLSEESTRWDLGSASFKGQMSTVAGDVLLSAAFMAYIGYFDEMVRSMLLKQWTSHLLQSGIKSRAELATIEYLSTPGDRVSWHANNLPADTLCEQNAIMLQRYNRYPLIIDPSGVATEFLTNSYADQKIVTTSFLDTAFMKSLESAMRFGTPIIIQDVENIDPVLNTVLNKEVHKTGGRSLVSLGDQDIDFSPAFKLFLVTRDPTFNFTPDLCSRVTFVNFTITPSSLQNQCLNKVLKIEQPEVDKRRSDLLKLQGEFKVRLRELEDSLLNTLNQAEGNILDDDKVITTLETLKRESAEVTAKAAQTSATMEEVEQTSNMYLPLALSCSRIYFAMESLADIHFFYQFSLKYFLQIFNDTIMGNKNLDGITDSNERLEILSRDLYNATFLRVCRGMQNQDTLTFALRLAQIRLTNTPRDLDEAEVNALLVGGATVQNSLSLSSDVFNKDQAEQLSILSGLDAFSFLKQSIDSESDSWSQFLTHATPEKAFPNGILTDSQQPRVMWQRMLLIKAVRPDRFLAVASEFVSSVLGSEIMQRPALDLAATVAQESDKAVPLLLCSMPGYDASSKVDQLAQTLNKQFKAIALGSPEGYELAEKSVTAAANSGTWVLLKNIHLAPEWLMRLEKQLHRLNKHNDFRLFFTMEMNPCVPRNVIRISQTFVFEPPAGIKASLKRSFATIPIERLEAAPAERPRVYLLLAWFNAVVQERKRYCPVGWTKRYEFSDNDLKHGLDTVDYWVDVAAAGRSNIAPEKIPWSALRQILCHVIYGGRVDNMFDTKTLASFIEQFFKAEAYNEDFSLVQGELVTLPESNKYNDIMQWINSLPDDQPPTWLGLSPNAELILSINAGKKVIKELQQIQQVVDVDDEDDLGERAGQDEDNAQPAWLKTLTPFVESWIKVLPKEVQQIPATSENLSNPIARFLDRELSFGLQLHQVIQCNLNEVLALCNGTKSPQAIRDIALELSKGLVPSPWRKYASMDFSMSTWFPNLLKRLEQLNNLQANIDKVASIGVWLGGLFSPEAFVTATRQVTAQRHTWALEQLELEVRLGSDLQEEDCFTICELNLENASLQGSAIRASDDVSTVIPKTVFRWVQQSGNTSVSKVSLPVYLDSSRKNLLLTIGVEVEEAHRAYTRGIAVVASI